MVYFLRKYDRVRCTVEKTLLVVAALPACGKNYVSEQIGNALDGLAYFDKDDLAPLLRRSFELCGEPVDMDGAFYGKELRDAEYETLLTLAFSALRFSRHVLVNAPFLKEVRDADGMRLLKEKAHAAGAKLVLVWVTASDAVRYQRMKARSSDRDNGKLARWEEYAASVDHRIPTDLEAAGAVDTLFVFDNENETAASASLQQLLKIIGG